MIAVDGGSDDLNGNRIGLTIAVLRIDFNGGAAVGGITLNLFYVPDTSARFGILRM